VDTPCLSASQFASSSTTFGTIPRNSFRGPGYFNTDLGLKKTFRLTERLGLTLGANAYNVLNHANFANPVSDLSSTAFGTILNAVQPPTSPYGAFAAAATDARIVQVMGKITF
jgi:hypothetical protein